MSMHLPVQATASSALVEHPHPAPASRSPLVTLPPLTTRFKSASRSRLTCDGEEAPAGHALEQRTPRGRGLQQLTQHFRSLHAAYAEEPRSDLALLHICSLVVKKGLGGKRGGKQQYRQGNNCEGIGL